MVWIIQELGEDGSGVTLGSGQMRLTLKNKRSGEIKHLEIAANSRDAADFRRVWESPQGDHSIFYRL